MASSKLAELVCYLCAGREGPMLTHPTTKMRICGDCYVFHELSEKEFEIKKTALPESYASKFSNFPKLTDEESETLDDILEEWDRDVITQPLP